MAMDVAGELQIHQWSRYHEGVLFEQAEGSVPGEILGQIDKEDVEENHRERLPILARHP